MDVSTQEFLSAERAFTYADLYAKLGNRETIAWLTPHAAVGRVSDRVVYHWGHLDESSCSFCFTADGKEMFALARSPEHLLDICDVVLRLLAASVVHSILLNKFSDEDNEDTLINAPTLAYLMEQCQSLNVLSLYSLEMDENHCRVLGAYSRPGLEIELLGCTVTRTGSIALARVLGRNQGPTKLWQCDIDNFVLAYGLRGNSRLKCLIASNFSEDFDVGNRQFLAIANALRENKGLVKVSLTCSGLRVSDETWGAVCDSLKKHPTLEDLNLDATSRYMLGETPPVTPDVITSRMQALVDMLKVNLSIHTIHLDSRYSEHEIYRESVIPYLKTNRFRPRLLAIQKTRPIAYRAKVLGRSLLATCTDTNSFWMLLSGNAEVAFPSRATTIAAAANLPTPTPATNTTATSTANVAAAVAASVTSALTTTATATGSLPAAAAAATTSAAIPSPASASDALASTPTVASFAVANVAAPSAGQKRKECP
jgi:hypothetical protein